MRSISIALLLCSVALPALAQQDPNPAGKDKDDHVRIATYDPARRVHLVMQKGMVTDIVFDPMEHVKRTVGINLDKDYGVIATLPKDDTNQDPLINNLPLIGRNVGTTDLVVVTASVTGAERPYVFIIDVVDREVSAVAYSLTFTYPIQAQEAKVQAAHETWKQRKEAHDREIALARLNVDVDYGPQNWRYLAQGTDRALAPVSIHDNGQITAFRFPGNHPLPTLQRAVYTGPPVPEACTKDGKPTEAELHAEGEAVDIQMVNDQAITHMTGQQWLARDGDQKLIYWNCGFNVAGANPGTGTTSGDVIRTLIPPKD